MKGDAQEVVLEGFHACKHAVRFGAEIEELVSADVEALQEMLYEYAPDIHAQVMEQVRIVSAEEFAAYSDIVIRTPLAGKARVPLHTQDEVYAREGVVVCLEEPRDLENIGAVVRLAAGMGCAGVVTTGDVDPWHKNCLRGSQGLHFALPVVRAELRDVLATSRAVVVFDESGQDSLESTIPENALLLFGSERQGVSAESLEQASEILRLPQREGVSSYNLATSVAMGLYHHAIQ